MAGGTRTVAYDRWYLDEVERAEADRAPLRGPAPRVRVDKREADPRRALATAAERNGEGLAALSRMIWRPSRYLDRFVREGRLAALTCDEHAKLAALFGVDERALGIRDLWLPA